MDISLKERTAVICGSTQGIGLAVARELASLGASCMLIARNESKLTEICRSLPVHRTDQQHGYRVADFSQTKEVNTAIDSIVSQQEVHILVNNTGGPAPGPLTGAAEADLENAFRQHVINNQVLARAVLPAMKK